MADNNARLFCGSCGSKIDQDKRFCGTCGSPIQNFVNAEQQRATTLVENAAKRFCGKCGATIVSNVNYCGSCGATLSGATMNATRPKRGNIAATPLPIRTIAMVGLAILVVIVSVWAVGNLFGGGMGGPTKEDMAKNSNFLNGDPSSFEIISMAKCKLTDLDRARGYEQKWWIVYEKKGQYGFVIEDAWAYDGYQWDDYFGLDSTVGCPN